MAYQCKANTYTTGMLYNKLVQPDRVHAVYVYLSFYKLKDNFGIICVRNSHL